MAAAGVAVGLAAGYGLRRPGTTSEIVGCSASLRAAAEASHLLVGAAAFSQGLRETSYANTLAREFNFLTPEDEMKWDLVHPAPEKWNFAPADELVEFASDHQMKVKGHALVWHERLPNWVNSQMSVDELWRAMKDHIRVLVSHYRGKVYAWDVVNEAIDTREPHGLRKTLFLEKLGEAYIARAFDLAHEADPDALLIYNETTGAAGLGTKSDRVHQLVKKLVADGVPIHGVGLQMHIDATDYPKPDDIAANVRRLAELGLKVNISEMDVRIRDAPGNLTQKLEMQRRVYHDVIAPCIEEDGFQAVTFWGLIDSQSWINNFFGSDDPLLFDRDYRPKPAYWGVMEALVERRL